MTDDSPPLCPFCRCVCHDCTLLHCPWGTGAHGRTCRPRGADKGYLYNCQICGSFVITYSDRDGFLKEETRNEADAWRLSALLRERKIQKMPTAWIRRRRDDEYATLVHGELAEPVDCVHMSTRELLSRWPDTVPEKLERTLQNLADLSQEGGAPIDLKQQDRGVCFAAGTDEVHFLLDALEEDGLIQAVSHALDGSSLTVVSAGGWARVGELTRGQGSPENPAFVAMWFGGEDRTDEMTELYEKSIQPAVGDAGYREMRVDGEEYNDFIMDKVLGSIRLAPFVIADFTGNRGGVYLEAGFARGLRKPVIHTCKKDDFDKTHFDIQQINTIKWKEPGDLREKLYHRIIGTIDEGPYKKREP